jgi:CBS domain containing-hemolysin-like protein
MTNDNQPTDAPRREGLLRSLRKRFRKPKDAGFREDLENIIETHRAENPGDESARETTSMMRNLITFSDLRVDDVMVPRADIVAIEDTAPLRDLMDRFTEANHSRVPVYHDTLDDVLGMIHVKDFLRWMTTRKKSKAKKPGLAVSAADLSQTVKQSGLLREVLFVPPSMPAGDLLVKMQSSHIHMALVIDEYGGSDGLVSIEDLVEEIIGDIEDEHDTEEEKLVKKQDDATYVADARVLISVLDKIFNVDLLPDEEEDEADTLGGLIFEMAGRVPPRGEIIRHASGLEFEILQSDPRSVKRIRIHVKQPEGLSGDEAASDAGA